MATIDLGKIESRIDHAAAGATAISMSFGGVQFQTMMEVMQFAKLMAVSGSAIPPHLRGNPGGCLAICTRALRFGFDPFALAEHSFVMKKPQKDAAGNWSDIETIAFDSFVIHAIIEAHAPIVGRLRPKYEGEGDGLKVTVFGTPKGERDPLVHTSQTVGEIVKQIGRNEKGKLRGSPLWETKPEQQIWYYARRDFCRKYFPEILLGWYDKDELEETARATMATDITPSIAKRLTGGKKKQGFDGEHVAKEIGDGGITASHPGEKGAVSDPVPHAAPEPASAKGGEPPEAEQSATPGAVPETPMHRGIRLLGTSKTMAEVNDLSGSIADELSDGEMPTWDQYVATRRKELVGK